MYRVAYDDGRQTASRYYSRKKNSEDRMKFICDKLCIAPIGFNTRQNLSEGWVEWSEIITEEQKQKGIFSTETKLLYNKQRNKNVEIKRQ